MSSVALERGFKRSKKKKRKETDDVNMMSSGSSQFGLELQTGGVGFEKKVDI